MKLFDSMLDLFRRLPDDEQRRLLQELARARMADAARRIAGSPTPATTIPVTDEELSRLVHEARREVLRARGL